MPAFLVVILASAATGTFGQAAATRLGQVKSLQSRLGLGNQQFKQILPSVTKQIAEFGKIYARHRDRAQTSPSPFWRDDVVWEDLRENRVRTRSLFNYTAAQRKVLRSIFLELEKETVLMLLDEQMPIWGQELELTDEQFEGLYQIVLRDISRRQMLISRPEAAGSLQLDLKAISDETDKSIQNLLQPEQLELWRKKGDETVDAMLRA